MPRLFKAGFLAGVLAAVAWADQSGKVTLAPNSMFNFESGAIVAGSGDVLWSGAALMPLREAALFNGGKVGERAFKAVSARYAENARFSSASIPSSALVAGDVFGVRTEAGRYVKVLVTRVEGTSISLEYIAFGEPGTGKAGPAPIINSVQNNYSYLLPGAPNYGIAPGSIFVIVGFNLASVQTPVLQDSSKPGGLPTSLNLASVSVTVNHVTTTPALYYASQTAIAGVLPSNTPTGDGTITVTYNGTPSQPAPIKVVASAVGLDTLYGAGSGSGVIEDINFKPFDFTHSAMPNQAVIIWGSGVGADPANDDRTYPQNQDNLTNIGMQVYVGGIAANILYRGRSQYPGLDEIDINVPQNAPLGCYISVVVQTGSITSNTVTLPISANGAACSDTVLGLKGDQLQALANKGTANSLALLLAQATNLAGTSADATAFAASVQGSLFGSGTFYTSVGNCNVVPPRSVVPASSALDPGKIQLNSPAGNPILAQVGGGQYHTSLASNAITTNLGTYTFTGSGGSDIGKFNIAVNDNATPFSVINANGLSSITRSQGATVNWSGGFASGYVLVDVVGPFVGAGSVNIYCVGQASSGQITIPASALAAVPAGKGSLFVTSVTTPQTTTATGADFITAGIGLSFQVATTFK